MRCSRREESEKRSKRNKGERKRLPSLTEPKKLFLLDEGINSPSGSNIV